MTEFQANNAANILYISYDIERLSTLCKGITENITVISVVGRYLEHSRIYIFGKGENEKVYISSTDFMTRNTERRVEVAVPILDEQIRKKITGIFELILKDDEKRKELIAEKIYVEKISAMISA